MKKLQKIMLFILLFNGIASANTIVAREAEPYGLYIVGPDVSPDSSEHTFLYYSPDGGYTLEIRDTLDWAGAIDCIHFAVDYIPDILYLNNVHGDFYFSSDGGINWEFRYNHTAMTCDDVRSGLDTGLIISENLSSSDYGMVWEIHPADGLFGILSDEFEIANPGLFFWENHDGVLFVSIDTFDTVDSIFCFGLESPLFHGFNDYEIYSKLGFSILRSIDGGSNFISVGSIPTFFQNETISGWKEGELICVGTKYNIIPMEGIFGGEIVVYHSIDYGMTWELIRHYEARIQETITRVNSEIQIYPNPFTHSIKVNLPIKIYNLSGREVSHGHGNIDLSSEKPCIYFVVANINGRKFSKKILKIQ